MANYTYTVSASYNAFNYLWSGHGVYNSPDPDINLTEGDNLTIINISGGHVMQIDGPAGFTVTEIGQQIAISNIAVGTYTYVCTSHPAMNGQIIVSVASSSSTAPGSGAGSSSGTNKKINTLTVETNPDNFDPKLDYLLVETDGSCHKITMHEISRILDIRRREANKTQWEFLDFSQSPPNIPVFDRSGAEITYSDPSQGTANPIVVGSNSSKPITLKIANITGPDGTHYSDPPSNCKRVMVYAEAKDVNLETRFRSETISIFKVRAPSRVIFILENIRDVTQPIKNLDFTKELNNNKHAFPLVRDGLNWGGQSQSLEAVNWYLNLKDSERSSMVGPILSDPNLIPFYNEETGQSTNLDAEDHVSIMLSNTSTTETGYIYNIRPIAWSY